MFSEEPIFFQSETDLPTRADALQNRAEILQVARRLFDEEGVENVSMSQIAREANVGKGTLYRHFRNKADLCHVLLDDDQRLFQEQTLDYLRHSQDTPCEKLRQFIVQVCQFTQRNLELLLEMSQGRIARSAEYLNHPAHYWQWQTVTGLLRQIEDVNDVEYVADIIYVMLDPATYYFQRFIRNYDHQRIVDGILYLLEQLTQ